MNGLQISLTGAVVFVFVACLHSMMSDAFRRPASVIALFGMLAIPTGLIIQIWS
jgi:hypothetical protein